MKARGVMGLQSVLKQCLVVTAMAGSLFAGKINLQLFAGRFDSIPIGVVDFKPKGTAGTMAPGGPGRA